MPRTTRPFHFFILHNSTSMRFKISLFDLSHDVAGPITELLMTNELNKVFFCVLVFENNFITSVLIFDDCQTMATVG